MALAGPPRSHENEVPLKGYFHTSCPSLHERPPCDENEVLPGLFSRQCPIALAGPPRRDENKEEEVVALVRRRLCLVQLKPVHASVTQEQPFRHPKLLP